MVLILLLCALPLLAPMLLFLDGHGSKLNATWDGLRHVVNMDRGWRHLVDPKEQEKRYRSRAHFQSETKKWTTDVAASATL